MSQQANHHAAAAAAAAAAAVVVVESGELWNSRIGSVGDADVLPYVSCFPSFPCHLCVFSHFVSNSRTVASAV
jgi:hypothetical protein